MRLMKIVVLAPVAFVTLAFCRANEQPCPVYARDPHLLSAWSKLLDFALTDSGPAKTCVQEVAEKVQLGPLRKLARHLLTEWDLPAMDARMKRPVMIWRPDVDFNSLPAENRLVSAADVMIEGEVGITGTLSRVAVTRSSGNAHVDDLCLAAAAKALYRPAREKNAYVTREVLIQFHLDPR